LNLRVNAVYGAEPLPSEWGYILQVKRRCILVFRIFVHWNKNKGEFSVVKYRAPFVQQIVYTELDAVFDNPAEGAIVMMENVVDQERVVGPEMLRR